MSKTEQAASDQEVPITGTTVVSPPGNTPYGMWCQQYAGVGTLLLGMSLLLAAGVAAQDNFEIQVYGSQTVDPGKTMVELHSNIAVWGTTQKVEGVVPTEHAVHATLEIT